MHLTRKAVSLLGLATFTALGLAATPSAQAQTVISENFSQYATTGGPVASTDYTLVNQGVFTGVSQYRVVANPAAAFTNGYSSYFDHTTGTASGAMLFFDGAGDGTSRVWYRQAALTAGTPYTVSFWGSASDTTSVPTLSLLVDGSALGTTLTTVNATWGQFTTTYTPTVTGPHTFAIIDTNTPSTGNDGALDDILVVGPAPEPSQSAALGLGVLGLSLLAFKARRRAHIS